MVGEEEVDLVSEKVGFIIQLARQLDNGSSFDNGGSTAGSIDSVDYESFDETLEGPTGDQISEYINSLNEDEALDLVALMWVGRGTYRAKQFDQARQVAAAEATNSTSEYLLGSPLLADYLEDGLEAMGISVAEAEEG